MIDAWDAIQNVRDRIDEEFNNATLLFQQAQERALPDSEEFVRAKTALGDLYLNRLEEARLWGELVLTPKYFRGLVESVGNEDHLRILENRLRVELTTSPAGAEVYCFRYEKHEEHLVPVPFDLTISDETARVTQPPLLIVEHVWETEWSPFEVGDRLLRVGKRDVRLRGDVAQALHGVKQDRVVTVEVDRAGTKQVLSWMPFPNETRPSRTGWTSEEGFWSHRQLSRRLWL